MNRLTYPEFLERRDEFDEAVDRTPEVTDFCSKSLWQCAAHDFLHRLSGAEEHLIVEDDGNWLALVQRGSGGVFFPLESAWMFGCPLIGDPERVVPLLREAASRWLNRPAGFVIGGVRKDGQLHRRLLQMSQDCIAFDPMPGTDVMEIDLRDGFDAWLSRRSKKFQKSVGQLAAPDGFEIVEASRAPAGELFQRILNIQRQTYKWEDGSDIFQEPRHARFYQQLLNELHASGALRVLFAQQGGVDVGHNFGARTGDAYRGFQMSYVERLSKHGIGNALQLENLRRCAAEGITLFDLGMHSPYKERWADRQESYLCIFIVI